MGSAGKNKSFALPLAIALVIAAAACAALFSSFGKERISVSFSAEPELMPRLKAMLEADPTPESWELRSKAESADYLLSLAALEPGSGPPAGSALCGTIYYAASVELSDPRYSVSASKAEGIGLVPLESILPPRRALAVDGAWPPSPAYPFSRRLVIAAAGRAGRRIPKEMLDWLGEAGSKASAAELSPLILAAVGDMEVGEGQGPLLVGGEEGLRKLLDEGALDGLRSADIAVGNLESPISARGEANPRKRYHFRMPPGASSAFKAAGFDLLLYGNNHVFDYGPEAFADTLSELEAASLPIVGAGRDLDEASAAKCIDARGRGRLAFVGFAFFPKELSGFSTAEASAGEARPGISTKLETALASVREASASGATVVVLAHGGAEYRLRPSDAARRTYARFVDAGAALVLGSHPHLLQGCEARSGSLIAYSLGNFLFTLGDEPPEAYRSALLDFLIYRGKVRGLLPRPVIAGYEGTRLDPDPDQARLRFSRLCAELEALPPLKPLPETTRTK